MKTDNEVGKLLYHCTGLLPLPSNFSLSVVMKFVGIAYRVSQVGIRLVVRLSFVDTYIHTETYTRSDQM